MIVILITVIVGIPLGHATTVSQPYYLVATQGRVSLPCSYKTTTQPKEMQVSLYKGKYGTDRICSVYVNISNTQKVTDGRMHCTVNVSINRVDLTIFGLRGEDTDLYRCQVDIYVPPPYVKMHGNGTLVYIPEIPSCPTEHVEARIHKEDPETSATQTPNQFLPIILLYAIFIITMISLILQLMKMILLLWKSTSTPQALSEKGGYINF